MLRIPGGLPLWQRLVAVVDTQVSVPVRPAHARRCPDCATSYEVTDRYCPCCHMVVPEWRFG